MHCLGCQIEDTEVAREKEIWLVEQWKKLVKAC